MSNSNNIGTVSPAIQKLRRAIYEGTGWKSDNWDDDFNEKVILNEMSQIPPEETGLPVNIWLDNDGRNLQHWFRIKFDPQNGTSASSQYPALTLSLNPVIPANHNKPGFIRTKTSDINILKDFMRKAELYRQKLIKEGKKASNEGLTKTDFSVLFQMKLNGTIDQIQ